MIPFGPLVRLVLIVLGIGAAVVAAATLGAALALLGMK